MKVIKKIVFVICMIALILINTATFPLFLLIWLINGNTFYVDCIYKVINYLTIWVKGK